MVAFYREDGPATIMKIADRIDLSTFAAARAAKLVARRGSGQRFSVDRGVPADTLTGASVGRAGGVSSAVECSHRCTADPWFESRLPYLTDRKELAK